MRIQNGPREYFQIRKSESSAFELSVAKRLRPTDSLSVNLLDIQNYIINLFLPSTVISIRLIFRDSR